MTKFMNFKITPHQKLNWKNMLSLSFASSYEVCIIQVIQHRFMSPITTDVLQKLWAWKLLSIENNVWKNSCSSSASLYVVRTIKVILHHFISKTQILLIIGNVPVLSHHMLFDSSGPWDIFLYCSNYFKIKLKGHCMSFTSSYVWFKKVETRHLFFH